MADDERAHAQAVFDRLAQTLADIVREVEARMGERCPYKSRDSLCTFEGGCQNQRRTPAGDGAGAATVACVGDHLILWKRHDEP